MNILLTIFSFLIPLEKKTSVWLNFGSGVNLTTIFTVLLLVAWLIRTGKSPNPSSAKNPLNIPVLLLIISIYFSFFTGSMKLAIPFFGEEFRIFKSFLTSFILFFIIANNVRDAKSIKLLLKIMTFMVILTAFISIKEFREADVWHYREDARVMVFGMQPNMLGAFLAQFSPIFAAFAFLSKKFKTKVFYIVLFSICLPGLMFTYSRGAYLGIAAALIIMGILGGRKSFAGLIVLLTIAILGQSVLFGHGRLLPVSVRERLEMIKSKDTRDDDHSIALRKQVWDDAVKYISQSPITGYGFGASGHLLFMDTHNMYLDIALESGIPTLLIFIWFILAALKMALKAFKSAKDDFYKAISLGFLGSVTALAVGNYFGTRLLFFAANGYFAILMGIVARIYAEQNNFSVRKNLVKVKAK